MNVLNFTAINVIFVIIVLLVILIDANNDNGNKFMNSLRSINENTILEENDLLNTIKHKTINIKIGVYNSAAYNNTVFSSKHYWILFDPLNSFSISNSSMLLPFILTPYNVDKSPFHYCDIAACSSIYIPTGNFPNMTIDEMKIYMEKSCQKIVEAGLPIRLWDKPSNISETIKYGLSSSLACYNKKLYEEPKLIKAIALNSVLDWIPTVVNYLDIDGQGADLPLLLSITSHLRKIRHIKVECQKEPFQNYYLYDNDIVNECNDIISFLQNHSFILKELQVNNCAISEFNAYFTNTNLIHKITTRKFR